jgi:hypothetical protein
LGHATFVPQTIQVKPLPFIHSGISLFITKEETGTNLTIRLIKKHRVLPLTFIVTMNHQAPTISREEATRPTSSNGESVLEHAELVSNLSIFRDLPPLDSNGMPTTTASTTGPHAVFALPFRRATPIAQSQSGESSFRRAATTAPTATARSFGGFSERRPVAPTSQDDMIEREQLWKLQPAATTVDASSPEARPQEQREPTSSGTIDFAPYFEFASVVENEGANTAAAAAQAAMECNDDDDFSVSSREADSLLSEEDLENISKDPVSFWEGSIDTIFAYRSVSPDPADQHSMMEIDNQETLPSPTSVAAIASIGLSHK